MNEGSFELELAKERRKMGHEARMRVGAPQGMNEQANWQKVNCSMAKQGLRATGSFGRTRFQ
jgi:hypothetical protein